MLKSFFRFKVKIRDEKFTNQSGITFSNMACISFIDSKNKEISYIELGYIDTEKVYDKIDKGQSINIDNCYIENFSLSLYRQSRNLKDNHKIELIDFSARNTFFDSRIITDFSSANFIGKQISFREAHFINGEVTFESSEFNKGFTDFSYSFFHNGNVNFSNTLFFNGDLSFKDAVFYEGKKDFQYADFGVGDVSFINTQFGNGTVAFINTHFNEGKVSFKLANFGNGKIDFHFSKFKSGSITFSRTNFGNGITDFRKVEFYEGKTTFNRAIFGNGDISFEGSSQLNGKLNFQQTKFGKGNINFELAEYENIDVTFEKADFGSANVSFFNSAFNTLSLNSCHLDNYFDFRVVRCKYLDLSNTIVRDIIDLIPYRFDVNIEILSIAGMRLLGSIYIDWNKNNVSDLIEKQKNASHQIKAEQYRILKENFNHNGQYSEEDKAYVFFKRHEMKSILHKSLSQNKFNAAWEYPWYVFKVLLFDKAGKYATDPLRVMISMVVVYVFFSIIYMIVLSTGYNGIVSGIGGEHAEVGIFARSLYHSAITFLTIGYGDYYPFGVIRWISSIEGFTGLFLMSYFTVAFVRKVLR